MTRRHDEGDGRHNNGKGQHGDMRHDDGKGQQGDRPYNDGKGRRRAAKLLRLDIIF
jgi:hypothetical protein